ncbi:MaoC family dehydratase [Nocardia cyriacigeorgica]|uniref:MaoC family dehydratase n=1 Tax=Nocardia cyriacigeorgica TaxID=135487 RepID=A0A6P1D2V2_9NOCA|nr:MaoC family dehydratase [Nocardia cyriacigeorgica]NEW37702.1 MaoC family dehydratase [Nocardia cyriacigeorgica]NEW43293.1 MaoC family dehydratase [Nocardia cyriacigeorgica]NEW48912.1 MaoC family dehydratase [Nocardia cyriacigeorgica]NEW55013.1 MaoC family dehydratase [Nocardia cyriacigeorgica]
MTSFAGLDEVRAAVGSELGHSRWIEIPQPRIDAFAEATEDRQWIHTDPVAAAAGPFGAPIAHGYLTLSLVSAFLEELLRVEGVAMAVNYGLNRVRFPAPVPAGARVRGHGQLAEVREIPGGIQTTVVVRVESDRSDKPVCVAETVTRFLDHTAP